jgi:(R,R)-butanediol dehydrogenase/meso-butanediol dehydrogenase/diacetyl reductase
MTYSIQEFEHVARVLDSGAVEPRTLVTRTISLEALPAELEALRGPTRDCKVMVKP